MDLQISCYEENALEIINKAIADVNKCAGNDLDWKIETGKYMVAGKTKVTENIGRIEKYLEKLLADYPQINISASYSCSCREEDGSAQWWESVNISTEKDKDGTKKLKVSSGTYWN